MQIPNTFKNRTGAIQLADLDSNFDIVQVTINQQAELFSALDSRVTSLTTQIANFSAIPIGCIVMWSGTISTIPDHWRLCDGTNGTPDLRDKFVIGARVDSAGRAQSNITGSATYTGGSKDSQLVSHSHTASSTANSVVSSANDVDNWDFTIRAQDGASLNPVSSNNITLTQQYDAGRMTTSNNYVQDTQIKVAHTHTHNHNVSVATSVTTTVGSEGVTGTNGNLPPYYALAYIMRV